MEQIKILFYVLGSFFGTENAQIASDSTTVTIYPEKQQIEIVQEGLFTMIQPSQDTAIVMKQWDDISHWKERGGSWAKELDSLTNKSFNIKTVHQKIQPNITLTYSNESELRPLGIWYNEEKKEFSINYIPQQNVKTESGVVEGNYWVFKADRPFSFSLEPFVEIPEEYLDFKLTLEDLLKENKKE
ncbi:hypothetical protein [Ulvibacter litoralis]|uniref:Uncharacterized protein n=1 Tax=Ulvibacter litoralis TaxID=227084 RepID=A0A1G7HCY2_9FLAO|nr:hypothetical protein [Ulvibacter litoralis]GHC57295.1 hypothetical protein GCM10008083_22280 [Ulvibacter litoralis]SDE98163.1 hypothetical protein SAMN05421855_10413 [Ulvibacter litoralis]